MHIYWILDSVFIDLSSEFEDLVLKNSKTIEPIKI